MLQSKIVVELDRGAIRQYIEMQLEKEVRETLWLIDLNKMAELTCMSPRQLENEIICDVRMKAIERKKRRKRWWPYKEAFEVISQITKEW